MRWLRGSASELVFSPWARSIEQNGGQILGRKRVLSISFGQTVTPNAAENPAGTTEEGDGSPEHETSEGMGRGDEQKGDEKACAAVRVETIDGEKFEADAVVLAVGISAAKVILSLCYVGEWGGAFCDEDALSPRRFRDVNFPRAYRARRPQHRECFTAMEVYTAIPYYIPAVEHFRCLV